MQRALSSMERARRYVCRGVNRAAKARLRHAAVLPASRHGAAAFSLRRNRIAVTV
ncbi:hypothetical protein HMPREF9136_0358 [Prevotella dentalis DSM 3688]|uniref:Uncharacterized protein n=1 Tax=Prevotella dentalis (strain ATCC 49559 / DSM 3688 / JCM 13448 / NCTC 12043 / ES 2772) TaxID=908937 RepID=F9D0I0_PREDD|nr:hypothetical protein HMPREF9136_0358 [Prevotella dentalis DSM 3688]